MRTAVVVFTRDLRVHDNPALSAAVRAAEYVLPVFVHDPSLPVGENRRRMPRVCRTGSKINMVKRRRASG